MAQKTKAELKAFFETGDVPTQSQFSDFIESYPNLTDLSVSETEFGYLDGVTSNLQTQIDGKQDVVAGVSSTEIGYLDGVTSAIQTQIDTKADIDGQVFTNAVEVLNAVPIFRLNDSTGAANEQKTNILSSEGAVRIQHLNDAGSGGGDYAEFTRSGNAMTSFTLYDDAVAKVVLSNNGKISSTSSASGTGVAITHSGTGDGLTITKTNSGEALDIISGSVRFQQLTADRWLYIDANNRVTVKTNAELLTAIGAITEVSEDTTPQLGGNLDAQSNNITNVTEITAASAEFTGLVAANSFEATNGATGSFTTTDGKTVTVTAGIITNIV